MKGGSPNLSTCGMPRQIPAKCESSSRVLERTPAVQGDSMLLREDPQIFPQFSLLLDEERLQRHHQLFLRASMCPRNKKKG